MITIQLAALRQLSLKLEIPALETEESIDRIIQQVQSGKLKSLPSSQETDCDIQLPQLHRKRTARIESSSEDEYEPQAKKPLIIDQRPKKPVIANKLDESGKTGTKSSVEVACIDQLTTSVTEQCNDSVDESSSLKETQVNTSKTTTQSNAKTLGELKGDTVNINHFLNDYYERFTQADIQEEIQHISDCLFRIISLHQQFRQVPTDSAQRHELEASKGLICNKVIKSMESVISVFPDTELSQVVTGITFIRVFEKFKMKTREFKFKTGLFQNCSNLLLSCLKRGKFTNSSLITAHLTDKHFGHFCIMLLKEIGKMTADTGCIETGVTKTTDLDKRTSDTGLTDKSDSIVVSSTIDSNVVASETNCSDSVLISKTMSTKSDQSKNNTTIVNTNNVSKPVAMETLCNDSGISSKPIVPGTDVSKTSVPNTDVSKTSVPNTGVSEPTVSDTSNSDTLSGTNQVGETISTPSVDSQPNQCLIPNTSTNQSVINETEFCENTAEVAKKSNEICETLTNNDLSQEKTTSLIQGENREIVRGDNTSNNDNSSSNIGSHVVNNGAVAVGVNRASNGVKNSAGGNDTTADVSATIADDIFDHINQIEEGDNEVEIILEQPRVVSRPPPEGRLEYPCILCTDSHGSLKFHDMKRDVCSTNLKAHLYLPLTRQFDSCLACFPLHDQKLLLNLNNNRSYVMQKIFTVNLLRYYRAWMIHVSDASLRFRMMKQFSFLSGLSVESVESLPDNKFDISESEKDLLKKLRLIQTMTKRKHFRYCTLKLYQVEHKSVRHQILTELSEELLYDYFKQENYDPFVANNRKVATKSGKREFHVMKELPKVSLYRLITSVNILLAFVRYGSLRQAILKEHDARILAFLNKFDIQLECDKLMIEPFSTLAENTRLEQIAIHLSTYLYTRDPGKAKDDRVNYAWYCAKPPPKEHITTPPTSTPVPNRPKAVASMPQLIPLPSGSAQGSSVNGFTSQSHARLDSRPSYPGSQSTPITGSPSNASHADMPSLEAPRQFTPYSTNPVSSGSHTISYYPNVSNPSYQSNTNNAPPPYQNNSSSNVSNPSYQDNTNNAPPPYQNNSSSNPRFHSDQAKAPDPQRDSRVLVMRPHVPAVPIRSPTPAPQAGGGGGPRLPRPPPVGAYVRVPSYIVQQSQAVPVSITNGGGLPLSTVQPASYSYQPPPSLSTPPPSSSSTTPPTASSSATQPAFVVPSTRGRGSRGGRSPRGGRGGMSQGKRGGGGGIRLVDPSRLYSSSALGSWVSETPPGDVPGWTDANGFSSVSVLEPMPEDSNGFSSVSMLPPMPADARAMGDFALGERNFQSDLEERNFQSDFTMEEGGSYFPSGLDEANFGGGSGMNGIRIENVLGNTTMEDLGETFCALCGAPAEMQCSGCNKIFYCTNSCQLKHWHVVHSRECTMQG